MRWKTVPFHSPGPADANALSPKVLYVCVTMHIQLSCMRKVYSGKINCYPGEVKIS